MTHFQSHYLDEYEGMEGKGERGRGTKGKEKTDRYMRGKIGKREGCGPRGPSNDNKLDEWNTADYK